MIHDDYLMRLLNQFARGMARILARRKQGDQPAALEEIDETMHELFGLRLQFFDRVSEGELAAILKSAGQFNARKAFIMAELLREHAEVVEEMNGSDESVIPLFLTSARLYADALTASEELRIDEFQTPFHGLCDRMEEYTLPLELMEKLMVCHEIMGQFSRAEDMLYRMMDVDRRRALQTGRAFYERLLERTDEDLEAGDLCRDEVVDGLKELEQQTSSGD